MHYNDQVLHGLQTDVVAPSLTPDALQLLVYGQAGAGSCSSLSHPGCTTIEDFDGLVTELL